MDPDRWQRVKDIFEASLDRPPDDRRAYLDSVCDGDADLRSSVEALLASDDEPYPALEPIVGGAGIAMTMEALSATLPDREVGHYRLLEEMGSGGMGTVYQAVRADGAYDQRVAVKLIKPGMASDDVLRRFRRERQLLARLDHPNIAKLLDGGAADDGSPYLVLEYIDGKPIHQYCDENQLTTDKRLRLFRTVCLAVQDAHRNLIVHRDLKPGNILVTPEGDPKLLDFGISKIVTGDPTTDTHTASGVAHRFMTPQYASPEQVQGLPVTTTSDVYSLGVILYELLTGHRPYDLFGEARKDAERLICDTEPDAPSTQIQRTVERPHADGTTRQITPELVSRARGTHPERLRKEIRGDLDTIVLTAMHKDPTRRYASVEQFSEDIRRYLDGLPVRAHRDSVRYRLGKFVRRNKLAVVAAIVVALSLAVGVVGVGVAYVTNVRALARVELQVEQTRVQKLIADRINEFLQSMLAARDPYKIDKNLTVKELLDETAKRIQGELGDEPEVRAAVHYAIGATYVRLDRHDEAVMHLREALDIRLKLLEPNHPDIATSYNSLGSCLQHLGQLQEAEGYLRKSLAIWKSRDEEGVQLVAVLNNLGYLFEKKGQLAAARDWYVQSLETSRRIDGGDTYPTALDAKNNLAALYARERRYDEAEPLYLEALEGSRATLEPDHPRILNYTNNLATLYVRQSRYSEALPLYEEVLAVSTRVLGREHQHTLIAMNNLALTCAELDQEDRAQQLYEEVLEIRRRKLGEEHAETGSSMNNLGMTYLGRGRFKDAESLFRKSLTTNRRLVGERAPNTLVSMNNLARSLAAQEQFTEAVALFELAIQTAEESLGAEHWFLGIFRGYYGQCLTAMNRFDQAERALLLAYEDLTNTFGGTHERTLRVARFLATLYESWGRDDEAEEYRAMIPTTDTGGD